MASALTIPVPAAYRGSRQYINQASVLPKQGGTEMPEVTLLDSMGATPSILRACQKAYTPPHINENIN